MKNLCLKGLQHEGFFKKKSTGEDGLYSQKINFFLISSLNMNETLEYIV